MRQKIKLILAFLSLILLHSCSSSNLDNPHSRYSNLKNFSARIELSSDTVIYGQTLWARVTIKNQSDEYDTLYDFDNSSIIDGTFSEPFNQINETTDTNWVCSDYVNQTNSGYTLSHRGYAAFRPYEEKIYYKYLNTISYQCRDSNSGVSLKQYQKFLSPGKYTVKFSYGYRENIMKILNAPSYTIKEGNFVAASELTCYINDNSYRYIESADSILIVGKAYIEKYKDTIYEDEFFVAIIKLMKYRLDVIKLEEFKDNQIILNKINYYIEKNPNSPLILPLLNCYEYYWRHKNSSRGFPYEYFNSLIKKFPDTQASIIAHEEIKRDNINSLK